MQREELAEKRAQRTIQLYVTVTITIDRALGPHKVYLGTLDHTVCGFVGRSLAQWASEVRSLVRKTHLVRSIHIGENSDLPPSTSSV